MEKILSKKENVRVWKERENVESRSTFPKRDKKKKRERERIFFFINRLK